MAFMSILCAIRVEFLWNLCEIFERRGGAAVGRTRSAKLSHEEPERPPVELDRQTERRLCRTTKRSGRGSNSFDKIVDRWSAAAVGQTRSRKLSSDKLPRFQRGCYSLLWICHQERIYFFTLFHTYLPTRVISTIWRSLRGRIIVLLSPFCRQVSHCILQTRILVCPLVFCLDRLIVFVVATFAPYPCLLQVI